MTSQSDESLPLEAQLAVVHTRPKMRGALRIFLELDMRMGRIVAGTSEPMLGQMRLAWWRDELGKPAADRPSGDAVLDGIGEYWAGRESALCSLVDGWEYMLAPAPMGEGDAAGFANGRAQALMAVYDGESRANPAAFEAAAATWAYADMAAKVSLEEERELLTRLGLAKAAAISRLARSARGLAVLGALGARSLRGGARPLMEGRTASLTATRAAIFGK